MLHVKIMVGGAVHALHTHTTCSHFKTQYSIYIIHTVDVAYAYTSRILVWYGGFRMNTDITGVQIGSSVVLDR